jgi:hypothetical protein
VSAEVVALLLQGEIGDVDLLEHTRDQLDHTELVEDALPFGVRRV